MVKVPVIDDSLFIRTWFGDPAAWDRTLAAVQRRSPEGYIAYVVVVDDVANTDAPHAELHEEIDFGEAAVAFIADELTQTDPEQPVLVLDVTGDENPPFRAPISRLWQVENEMNLGDLEWADAVARFSSASTTN